MQPSEKTQRCESIRENAEELVRYFEQVAHETNEDWAWKGLNTAQEYLQLIDTEDASPGELFAFIDVVHANRTRGSAWHDLAIQAHRWIQTKGIPVPHYFCFIDSGSVPVTTTPVVYAHFLVRAFDQHKRKDPSSAIWALGLETTQEWLRLINMEEPSKSEVSSLLKKVFTSRCNDVLWNDLRKGFVNWCQETGNSDLIPDDARWMLHENG